LQGSTSYTVTVKLLLRVGTELPLESSIETINYSWWEPASEV